jgi:hypothetical protein
MSDTLLLQPSPSPSVPPAASSTDHPMPKLDMYITYVCIICNPLNSDDVTFKSFTAKSKVTVNSIVKEQLSNSDQVTDILFRLGSIEGTEVINRSQDFAQRKDSTLTLDGTFYKVDFAKQMFTSSVDDLSLSDHQATLSNAFRKLVETKSKNSRHTIRSEIVQ